MTDRWRNVFVAGAFGVALVLCLNVLVGCSDDGDKGSPPDGAVSTDATPPTDDATTATDSGDAPDTDADSTADAAPPSLPDAATAD